MTCPIHEKLVHLIRVPSLDDIENVLMKIFSNKTCFKKQRFLKISHLEDIEKTSISETIGDKINISIVVYMQQALRVLSEEFKTENPNINLTTQTMGDVFQRGTESLDQLARAGAHMHMLRSETAIDNMSLENIRDVAKLAE